MWLILAKKLEETLSEDKKAKKNILNSTKILKLRSLAEDAMWNALRLVDERKDMVFESVANGLDGVANLLSELSEDSFSENRETETQLRAALENVNGLIVQIDDIVGGSERIKSMKRIIAIGGGEIREKTTLKIDEYIAGLAKRTCGRQTGERLVYSYGQSRFYALLQFLS